MLLIMSPYGHRSSHALKEMNNSKIMQLSNSLIAVIVTRFTCLKQVIVEHVNHHSQFNV